MPRGLPVTQSDVEELAAENEHGFDVEKLLRRVGRPRMGPWPAEVLPVRLLPELKQAVERVADRDDLTTSDVIRGTAWKVAQTHLHSVCNRAYHRNRVRSDGGGGVVEPDSTGCSHHKKQNLAGHPGEAASLQPSVPDPVKMEPEIQVVIDETSQTGSS